MSHKLVLMCEKKKLDLFMFPNDNINNNYCAKLEKNKNILWYLMYCIFDLIQSKIKIFYYIGWNFKLDFEKQSHSNYDIHTRCL